MNQRQYTEIPVFPTDPLSLYNAVQEQPLEGEWVCPLVFAASGFKVNSDRYSRLSAVFPTGGYTERIPLTRESGIPLSSTLADFFPALDS